MFTIDDRCKLWVGPPHRRTRCGWPTREVVAGVRVCDACARAIRVVAATSGEPEKQVMRRWRVKG